MNPVEETFAAITKQRQLLATLIFALVAVIVWIGVSFVSSQRTTGIPRDLQIKSRPLTPTINRQVLQRIEQKQVYRPNQLEDFPILLRVTNRDSGGRQITTLENQLNPQPSPSSVVPPTPSPSVSATLSPAVSATPSPAANQAPPETEEESVTPPTNQESTASSSAIQN